MHHDEGCYGQLGLLLSIGPTHHVNYWTSLADFVCNAESLEHLPTSNPGVRTVLFEAGRHLSNFDMKSLLCIVWRQLRSIFCASFVRTEYKSQ
jgi:hypothetical protein